MKHSSIKIFLYIFFFLIFSSCKKEEKQNETMKNVVKEYFSKVKKGEIIETPKLFWQNDIFSGAIQSEAFFINKHYEELKIDSFLNHIKIKDTVSIIPSQKQKYIQFTFMKSEDNLPVIFTFIFDKMYGFEKIASPNVLQNQMYWNNSLDSLHKKGIFPRAKY